MWESTRPLSATFVETHVFTKRIVRLGLEQPLRELQIELAANPKAGDVDSGTGGLRKVRVPDPGREGKTRRRASPLPLGSIEGTHLPGVRLLQGGGDVDEGAKNSPQPSRAEDQAGTHPVA